MSIRDYLKEVKTYKQKEKQKKKEDKALLKRLEQEEKELEIDIPEAQDKFSFKEAINIMKNSSDLDEELLSYMTDEEKKTIEENKKQERKLYIMVGSILGVVAIIAGVAIFLLTNQGGGTIFETAQPALKEYIKETYNLVENIISIEQITYREEDGSIIDSNMYVATTTNDHQIVFNENLDNYADNISNNDIYEEYNKLLRTITGDYDIISNNPVLSHSDYYFNYNLQTNYIDVLPTNITFTELIDSGKLTISDIIMYQGSINFKDAKNIISKLSPDSRLIFIKNEKGLPKSISFISKTEYVTINIKNTLEPIEGINYYDLDTEKNATTSFNITKVKDTNVAVDETHEIKNSYLISYNDENDYKMDGTYKTKYFFISFDKNLISSENIYIFNENRNLDNQYSFINIYDYPLLYTSLVGGKIYMIGTDKIGIANIYEKEQSFLCKIGLC